MVAGTFTSAGGTGGRMTKLRTETFWTTTKLRAQITTARYSPDIRSAWWLVMNGHKIVRLNYAAISK